MEEHIMRLYECLTYSRHNADSFYLISEELVL
jgi:hypothetical protein